MIEQVFLVVEGYDEDAQPLAAYLDEETANAAHAAGFGDRVWPVPVLTETPRRIDYFNGRAYVKRSQDGSPSVIHKAPFVHEACAWEEFSDNPLDELITTKWRALYEAQFMGTDADEVRAVLVAWQEQTVAEFNEEDVHA